MASVDVARKFHGIGDLRFPDNIEEGSKNTKVFLILH